LNLKEQYKSICAQRSDLPVFLQHWWLDAVCENWDVAITKNGDNIAGVWPYGIESRIGVKLLRTPKLTPYQGPYVFYPTDLKQVNRDGFEQETISDLQKQLPASEVWNLAIMPGLKQAGLFKNAGLEISVRQTFLIDITSDEPTLLGNMKESLRRNIKAAETEFAIVNDTNSIELLYEYQKHTLSNKDVVQAHSLGDMQKLMQACIAKNSAALWVAKKGEAIQALIWNVWDHERSYYFMGAQKPGNDNYKVMPALLWHCIKEAKKRGNIIFDLEGSMDAGVERFFRGFGGNRELYLVLKKNDSWLWKLKEVIKG
jgi:lipid II:glycine glycyltransferase (peptidoglycan interpeptide bridge formation enzyme)